MVMDYLLDRDEPAMRIDPAVEVIDPRFRQYVLGSATLERLWSGGRWTRSVWFGDQQRLLFSDIPNDRIMCWSAIDGSTQVFRHGANFANGNTRDRRGRLVTCEHGRRVTRTKSWFSHSVTRCLCRQKVKRAERCRRAPRWQHLVYRPRLRQPWSL